MKYKTHFLLEFCYVHLLYSTINMYSKFHHKYLKFNIKTSPKICYTNFKYNLPLLIDCFFPVMKEQNFFHKRAERSERCYTSERGHTRRIER